MKQTFLKATAGLVGVFVFLGVLIAANAILAQVRIRKDMTREGLYTLSQGTRQLVGELPREVTFKFYHSRSAEGLPVQVKHYGQRILDLLKEYERAGGGKVVLEVLDPQPDSDEEEWAQRYGVQPQNLNPLGGVAFYLGLVATAGSKEAVIPVFSPSQEPQLEYLLTRMIAEVTRTEKTKIGVLSSLPVMGMGMNPGMFGMQQRSAPPWALITELRAAYEVEQVNPAGGEIPADIRTLLVIHPKELPESALFALDQFVLRGGRLIAFVDPVSLADQELQPQQMGMMMGGNSSDLNKLTQAWGLTYDSGRVLADLRNATRVRTGDGRVEQNPSWLTVRGASLSKDEVASASLEFLMLPFAGTFSGQAAEGLTLSPLITASPGAGTVDGFSVAMGRSDRPEVIQPATGTQYVAVRLAGTFKTAFPAGAPAADGAPADPAATNALKESQAPGAVVLVADVDLIHDRFAIERTPFFGREVVQLANDNLNFVLNLVEQLSGNDALIGLRSRGSYEKPFERVIALEEKAQASWREEEQKLQERIEATQQRLNELQAQKGAGAEAKFVLSAEQQQEVEKFRRDMFETRKQLKEVRKNLRGEIETLGFQLKALNIALMPALVALFGIAYGLRRRSRAARG